jgi:hypothetical protein
MIFSFINLKFNKDNDDPIFFNFTYTLNKEYNYY